MGTYQKRYTYAGVRCAVKALAVKRAGSACTRSVPTIVSNVLRSVVPAGS